MLHGSDAGRRRIARLRIARLWRVVALAFVAAGLGGPGSRAQGPGGADQIPDLVGTWSGENRTISDKKGHKSWPKTVHITEQTDRRFRGYFDYSAGRKTFFGVIYPDNIAFTWVASDSKGYNHGRILSRDLIAACYVEPGAEATAGCAELVRQE